MAYVTMEFPGWPLLEQQSHDIIIGRCSATPDLYDVGKDGVERNSRGLINSQFEIVSVLKGVTNSGAFRLVSEYRPRQGEYYLIFSGYHGGSYQAFEAYRIVPLGIQFVTNDLSGKSLDEKIQMLLEHRLNDLKRLMQEDQEEKRRLEEGLKK